jgi:pantoate--beta-alanine ligase
VCHGTRRADEVTAVVRAAIEAESRFDLEYVEIRTAADLAPIEDAHGEVVIAVAARLGRARMIDNVVLTITDAGVGVDAGVRIADEPDATDNS